MEASYIKLFEMRSHLLFLVTYYITIPLICVRLAVPNIKVIILSERYTPWLHCNIGYGNSADGINSRSAALRCISLLNIKIMFGLYLIIHEY